MRALRGGDLLVRQVHHEVFRDFSVDLTPSLSTGEVVTTNLMLPE